MPSGIIIIDKPKDWTSMDVCGKLRRFGFDLRNKKFVLSFYGSFLGSF